MRALWEATIFLPKLGPASSLQDTVLMPQAKQPTGRNTVPTHQPQFSSLRLLCPVRLFKPMNSSTPGILVYHQLLEFTQTHVHRVGDAIQPSHSLSSLSPPAPNPSQDQGLSQWVNSSHEVAKVLELQLQHQSILRIFRTDFLKDGLAGSLCSPSDSQESSPTPQFKSINFFGARLSSQSNSHIPTWPLEKP